MHDGGGRGLLKTAASPTQAKGPAEGIMLTVLCYEIGPWLA